MKLLLVFFSLYQTLALSISQCGSFFRLLKDVQDTSEGGFLQPEFFICSIDKSCSYVIQYKKTNKFKIFKDKMELESLKEPVALWKKMPCEECKQGVSDAEKLGAFVKMIYHFTDITYHCKDITFQGASEVL